MNYTFVDFNNDRAHFLDLKISNSGIEISRKNTHTGQYKRIDSLYLIDFICFKKVSHIVQMHAYLLNFCVFSGINFTSSSTTKDCQWFVIWWIDGLSYMLKHKGVTSVVVSFETVHHRVTWRMTGNSTALFQANVMYFAF